MTVQSMLRCCNQFCRRMICMFGPSPSLYFDKSGLIITIEKEILGEGGYSTVYKASNRKASANTQYAIKRVLVQTEEINNSTISEIRALNEFRQCSIIRMIDYSEGRDETNTPIMYLLFPLMRRGTLRDLLNSRLKSDPLRLNLDLMQTMRDFKAICAAFNYMHTFSPVKYIHQDIKPENILISDDGSPLLTDFGSVRAAEIFIDSRNKALTIADEAAQFCTLPYRAPELFDPPSNTMLDSRTDVWGIGCLLFAWWYAYSPFECEFSANDHVRVVECSYSRVLSKIPTPQKRSSNDTFIIELVDWILVRDMDKRPFCIDIVDRLSRVENGYTNV